MRQLLSVMQILKCRDSAKTKSCKTSLLILLKKDVINLRPYLVVLTKCCLWAVPLLQ